MTDDRSAFEAARAAGKARQHEQRLARATDRDLRREVADEIASVLETRADEITTRSKGLRGDEFWVHVGLARGYHLAAEKAAQIGRKESS